jgi:hypothetical protein
MLYLHQILHENENFLNISKTTMHYHDGRPDSPGGSQLGVLSNKLFLRQEAMTCTPTGMQGIF